MAKKAGNMKKEEFDKINALESTHWWYVGTRNICLDLLSNFISKNKKLEILDVGCGTGGNLLALSKLGNASGIDVNPYAVELCKRNGFNCEAGNIKNLNLKENTYDLITTFDVLCQIDLESVPKVLRDIKLALKESGVFMFREPALKIASGRHDLDVNIHFRLNSSEAKKLLEDSGFEILRITYINLLLFVPIVIKRKIDLLLNKMGRSDVHKHSSVINFLFLEILKFESLLLKFIDLPFGVSVVSIARRPYSV